MNTPQQSPLGNSEYPFGILNAEIILLSFSRAIPAFDLLMTTFNFIFDFDSGTEMGEEPDMEDLPNQCSALADNCQFTTVQAQQLGKPPDYQDQANTINNTNQFFEWPFENQWYKEISVEEDNFICLLHWKRQAIIPLSCKIAFDPNLQSCKECHFDQSLSRTESLCVSESACAKTQFSEDLLANVYDGVQLCSDNGTWSGEY